MKKKLMSLVLACLGAFLLPFSMIHANSIKGADGWTVTFQGNKLKSNFTSREISETAAALQPGDDVTFTMTLNNSVDKSMEWWIKNDIISSFEDNSVANGGAYTYQLTYTDQNGNSTDLYNSQTVGGEGSGNGGTGLHEATNALDEYLYLDTLSANGNGKITLKVGLDGETQGNTYQNTLAKLKASYAVQPETKHETTEEQTKTITTNSVKTGDNTDVFPYLIAMLASGCVLMFLAFGMFKKNYAGLLILCAMFFLLTDQVKAAENGDYTYTVTISAGKQSTFNSGRTVVIKDIPYGKEINLSSYFQQAAANIPSDSKYYAKDIHIAGQDTTEAKKQSFLVTQDVTYVVSYGMKGQTVAYTVNFLDTEGNTLATSKTFYGNVGDKPVIACEYIEGYLPDKRNVTRTLVSDESQNVFNFYYTQGDEVTTTTTKTETIDGGATGTGNGTGNGAATDGDGTGNGTGNGTTDGNGGGTNNGTDGNNTDGDDNRTGAQNLDPDGIVDIVDEDIPVSDQTIDDKKKDDDDDQDGDDTVTLDDEQKPTKNLVLDHPITTAVAIGSVSLLALLAGVFFFYRRKKM